MTATPAKRYGFLIDMDGVLYRGPELLPGAGEFVGERRTFNLELVETAVRMITRGAKLIATNLDPNCPTERGLRPGCGAMVAMLELATGVKAFSVGKPSPVMMRAARKELGLATDE